MSDKKFPVMEIFGPTIQGEGAMCGYRTYFVRFGGCDFRCGMCDSMHAVLPERVKAGATMMSISDIVLDSRLGFPGASSWAEWVTLSGGNPAMWDLTQLVNAFHERDVKVALETQGSIWRPWFMACDNVTVSPKGPGMLGNWKDAYEPDDWKALGRVCEQLKYHQKASLKVVLFGQEDIDFAKEVHSAYPWMPLYLSMGNRYLEGNLRTESLRARLLDEYQALIELVGRHDALSDAIFLPQLHVLVWGNELGR